MTSFPRPRLLGGIALVLAALAPAAHAQAKPGDLDLTFGGGDGVFSTHPIQSPDRLINPAMALGLDGTIAVAGSNYLNPVVGFVYRVGPDGLNAQESEPLNGFTVRDIAFQPDGKVLVAGSSGDAFAVARLGVDGQLDPTYAGDGTYEGVDGLATEIAVDPDGSAIVVGKGTAPEEIRVERIGPGGAQVGSYTADAGAGAFMLAVALQQDGGILASGYDSSGDPLLFRLTAALTPDPAFSPNLAQLSYISDIEIQPDGRIVLGTITPRGAFGTEPVRNLVRLRADGTPDPSFSAFTTEAERGSNVSDTATDAEGRIIFTGYWTGRVRPDGSLDPSFGSGGIRPLPEYGNGYGLDVALQGDGKILTAHNDWLFSLGVTRLLGGDLRCAGQEVTHAGTDGGEEIRGTNGRDVIAALGGKDRVLGLRGDDIACGGDGRDRLLGGAGRDRLFGEAGRDVLRGGKGKDVLRGGKGRDAQKQ